MYIIIYLPDPTNIAMTYTEPFEQKEAAQFFVNFWEGSKAYLYEVVEAP